MCVLWKPGAWVPARIPFSRWWITSAHSGCDFLRSLFDDCILEIFSVLLGWAKDWLSPLFQKVCLVHHHWAWPIAVTGPLRILIILELLLCLEGKRSLMALRNGPHGLSTLAVMTQWGAELLVFGVSLIVSHTWPSPLRDSAEGGVKLTSADMFPQGRLTVASSTLLGPPHANGAMRDMALSGKCLPWKNERMPGKSSSPSIHIKKSSSSFLGWLWLMLESGKQTDH